MAGKYRLSTLGCKVNQYESEQVRQLLESLGMRPARPGEQADLAVANTCAVTCSASAKSRQTVRRLSHSSRTSTIAIGCYASADPQALRRITGVTDELGHDDDALARIRAIVLDRIAEIRHGPVHSPQPASPFPTKLVQVALRLGPTALGAPPGHESPPDRNLSTTRYSIGRALAVVNSDALDSLAVREFAGRTRAFLKIQDGCDAHCTYCIIPRLRKNLRFKPAEVAVAEARQLVAAGHKEIVLTGIYLGAYGRPTALRRRFAPGPSPLAGLVAALAKVEGLERLRLSSLEPGDVDDALLEVLATRPNCVPHLHLPLQAGSAEVLRRMNRQYTLDDFDRMVDRVKAALDRPAITTDIIVGFPGETDALFEQTLATARRSGFCKIHAFPFSPRPGTAAARWAKDFVHSRAIKDRMDVLRDLEQELSLAYRKQFLGETARVIVEGNGVAPLNAPSSTPRGMLHGRSDRYFEVHFESNTAKPGDVVDVRMNRVTLLRSHGACVTNVSAPQPLPSRQRRTRLQFPSSAAELT
jgi:threonylcarbamoyladenosine tRNA methylthiotransferase MtaB